MSYKLVLIDLDDTLFDYSKTEKEAFRRTFEELGFFVESELGQKKKEEIYEKIKDRYKDVNLQLWKDLEKGAVDKDRLKVVRFEKIIEEFDLKYNPYEMSELYLKKLGEGIFPFEATEKLCEYLHSKYKVGIVTNGIKEVQHSRIENSAISKYIDKIIISDEVGVNKPDKRIFEYAINYFEIMDKSEVIMIGDSLGADIKGGQNAGIDTCWVNLRNNVNDTGIVPKYEVNKLEKLFEIL
ncbi:YjjG family noncanonical pyrimidine nucleotidase [Leptotrichia hofstadii]|uniref:HAD hydrolase, TIGR02254 family n=1 Tax=Leptotrichia hofstadii F0254 TaxID=634994 RepID=C9MUE0_9FUSO|nr:YjjG family noncanonical pyrimidine nucleotidase [Leptotrichia hofstadii]EEX75560.1 HAD hydrolase, TIGR02254 family [Leptotrichia hofstadii F0254]